MRITVCELPHEPAALMPAWERLCEHTTHLASELVLLPEFAMVDPVWESKHFALAKWEAVEALSHAWIARLRELNAGFVVSTRPVTIDGRRLNQGFIWSAATGVVPLRSKHFLPDEEGGWEARWFDRGDAAFPEFRAGDLTFGLNICTELWALETYAAYAAGNVQVVMAPRATASATAAKWLSAGVVAAVRSGAFSLSSNRVDSSGACGGVGWIISPDGEVLARTSAEVPFATIDIVLTAPVRARAGYPRYVFSGNDD